MSTLVPEAVATTPLADAAFLPPLDSLYVRGRMAAGLMGCLSVVLFVVACALPALALRSPGGYEHLEWSGNRMLAMGWLGLFIANLGWYANPVLLVGWISLARFVFGDPRARPGKTPLICGMIALVLGAGVFQLAKIPANEGER